MKTDRSIILAILIAGAMVAYAIDHRPAPMPAPPAPAPAPDGWPTIDLRGAFVGPDAAEDATATERLTHWLGKCIAYDGTLKEPRLKTAAAFDDLRKWAREGRMEGVTLGAKQPIARERIAKFLDESVGTDGGPVDGIERANWVRALEDISKASAIAAGR